MYHTSLERSTLRAAWDGWAATRGIFLARGEVPRMSVRLTLPKQRPEPTNPLVMHDTLERGTLLQKREVDNRRRPGMANVTREQVEVTNHKQLLAVSLLTSLEMSPSWSKMLEC